MTDLGQKILSLSMGPNDAGAATIKDYLLGLLREVWVEEEGFDGKRPFGNSGWQYEVYQTLFDAGILKGEIDKWDELVIDHREADRLVIEAINSL